MTISNLKTIAFRVEEDFHLAVKMQALSEKKTLQQYIVDTLKQDMENKKK